jgi:putative ABC transport system permease protein
VTVLGSTVATNLFGADSNAALNQAIRINHEVFKVVGVLDSAGEPGDSMVVMPLNTARHYVYGGGNTVGQLLVQATHAAAVPAATDEVIKILSIRHRINDPTKRDFQVQSLRAQLETYHQVLRFLGVFTASIAAISLVVGSIGVLNIMLVSVTERTQEIGIRKAIGATRRAILEQFLLESVMLAGLGGLIGVGIGVGLSALIARLAPFFGPTFAQFAPAVSFEPVVVALLVSLAVGIIAGGYPSLRAARLQPIEALRHQ